MLIRFSVANFLSFGAPGEFSAIASREVQHQQRVAHDGRYGFRLLPVAAVYGANASGKSNLVKALDFAKQLVTRGGKPDQEIPVLPFRLGKGWPQQPSAFRFELRAENGTCYEYGFQVDRKRVVEEHLTALTKTSARPLFSRQSANGTATSIDVSAMKGLLNAEDFQFLQFTARGTRPNQLFLTESVERNMAHFRPVYDWFRNVLRIIFPETTAPGLEFLIADQDDLQRFSTRMLAQADTGIVSLETEDVPFETLNIDDGLRQKLRGQLTAGIRFGVQNTKLGTRYSVWLANGEPRAKRLVCCHLSPDAEERVRFDLGEESQGTQRYVDLLPALYELSASTVPRVYVIDELDRTLHSQLTQAILEHYLGSCTNQPRSQLIFTTHDQMLLNQRLFRRDELWFVDRREDGGSALCSLSDFRGVRNDKDIRRSYRLGRYGGVPRIRSLSGGR